MTHSVASAVDLREQIMAVGRRDLERMITHMAGLGLKFEPDISEPDLTEPHWGPCPVGNCGYDLRMWIATGAPWGAPGDLVAHCDGPHETEQVMSAVKFTRSRELNETLGLDPLLDDEGESAEWLIESVVEAGQLVSIYGPPKTGKSLFAQDEAAQLALRGYRVLYIDAENPRREVRARFSAMGHQPESLAANLTYRSFPAIPPLDTPAGAAKLHKVVDCLGPFDLVVIDTWSKVISGDENQSSTHNDAYRLSLAPLRARGIAVLLLDHAGGDIARGPRGSSAKVDNVDALWLITAKTGGRIRLERTHTRTGRGSDLVELIRRSGPLRHDRIDLSPGDVLDPAVRACVAKLDQLGVSPAWGREKVRPLLVANNFKVRDATLSEALRVRRDRGVTLAADLVGAVGDPKEQGRDQVAA